MTLTTRIGSSAIVAGLLLATLTAAPQRIDLSTEQVGKPPAAFANIGPSYLWISQDNNQRGNMTACGASGLSGAGGCS